MRLMISVVSAQEACAAISGGSALLDVKNPEEGSLGAPIPRVIREVKDTACGNIEISAAIGDLPNLPGTAALAALGAATCGADYIKVGLHGVRTEPEAIALMRAVKGAVGESRVSIIAAGYADYHRIAALDPRCLPRVAKEAGIRGCLIDTAVKDGSTLLDYMATGQLAALAQYAHANGLLFAAAGALREDHLPILRDSGIDIAGLRTAVCRNGDRNAPLDPLRVRDLIRASTARQI